MILTLEEFIIIQKKPRTNNYKKKIAKEEEKFKPKQKNKINKNKIKMKINNCL